MTKQSQILRPAALLLFLIMSVCISAGQTPEAGSTLGTGPGNSSTDNAGTASPQTSLPKNFKRWGLSLHAGLNFPHGDFNTFFDSGPSVAIDLEYRMTRIVSLEAVYGFHHFSGATLGSLTVRDLNAHELSLNGKVYPTSSPTRPFFSFGGGAYRFDPGSTRPGLNAGAGVQFDVTPTVAVEASYKFHNVFTSGSSTRFSTLQGGVRFRF